MPSSRMRPDRQMMSTPANGAPLSNGSQIPPFHIPPMPRPFAATPERRSREVDFSPNMSMSFSYLPSIGAVKGGDVGEQSMRGMLQVSPQVRPGLGGGFRAKVVRKQSRLSRGSPVGNGGDSPSGFVGPSTRSRLRASSDDEDMEVDPLRLVPDTHTSGEQSSWSAIDNMRLWRHDAIMQHLYETAAFWGDKVLSWTGHSNDAFWLAQIHFLTGHYLRAERILVEPRSKQDAPHGKGKGKADGRLVDESLACRYLAAQCMVHQEKYQEALELLGDSNPFKGNKGPETRNVDQGIKLESTLCHLRAILQLRLSSFTLAKESFMEALAIDVKNYDAFKELIEGQMMTGEEEWEFITNLNFAGQLEAEEAGFVQAMYSSKLSKTSRPKAAAEARKLLETVYGLADNSDILVGLAEELFNKSKWEECYLVTSKILARIPGHAATLPLHLACMLHIHRLRSSLFILAHELVEQDPGAATTWYAVGLWYFAGKRWTEARRYFSKANLIDSRLAPAWIAFAHSFAYEGEHEQAITAYSTSARLFQGSHLPLLFIGMEHLQLSQTDLAEEYFMAAKVMSPKDPLLLNELGVVAYDKEDYKPAIEYFEAALQMAKEMQGSSAAWAATHCNLGHAYRKESRLVDARMSYNSCVKLDPLNATAYTSLALISHYQHDVRGAIKLYHQALSLAPQDALATVLLELALEDQVEVHGPASLPGLPVTLQNPDLDPFKVPKGNAMFGNLPIEKDPMNLNDAGAIRPAAATPIGDWVHTEEGWSMTRRTNQTGMASVLTGDGSTMDIED